MSAPINDGGPAFPCMTFTGDDNNGPEYSNGMTLRDWFAGREQLQDCVEASAGYWEAVLGEVMPKWQDDPAGCIAFESRARAQLKFMRADAMLAEREKGGAA